MEEQLTKEQNNEKTIVSFYLDEQEYGIDIGFIQEIIQMVEITKVPESPPSVKGIINLRGKVVPIVNLRLLLNMQEKTIGLNTPIIVVSNGSLTLGFIIDSVEDVINIPDNLIDAPSDFYPVASFLEGVCKIDSRLLLLFDVNKLFSIEDKQLLEQLALDGI